MLLLTRKLGEQIIIGEGETQAVVTIVSFSRGQVKLGIDAQKHIPIHRREIYERLKLVNGDDQASE